MTDSQGAGGEPNDLLLRAHRYLNTGAPGLSRRASALQALAWFEEAVAVTRTGQDARAHSFALRSHAEGLWAIGQLHAALEPLVEAARAADAAGEREVAVMGLAFAAYTAELIGETVRWRALIEEAMSLGSTLQSPFAWIYCRIEFARGLARSGRTPEAKAIADAAWARVDELPPALQEALRIESGFPLGDLLRHLSRPQEAVVAIELTLAAMETRQVLAVVHVGWRLLAEALVDLGQLEPAKKWLALAIERADALQSGWDRETAEAIVARLSARP